VTKICRRNLCPKDFEKSALFVKKETAWKEVYERFFLSREIRRTSLFPKCVLKGNSALLKKKQEICKNDVMSKKLLIYFDKNPYVKSFSKRFWKLTFFAEKKNCQKGNAWAIFPMEEKSAGLILFQKALWKKKTPFEKNVSQKTCMCDLMSRNF